MKTSDGLEPSTLLTIAATLEHDHEFVGWSRGSGFRVGMCPRGRPPRRPVGEEETTASSPVARASGAGLSTFKTSTPPINAPSSIAAMESPRRPSFEPCPPASAASAATPVKVMVSTVVVRSGMASFLAVAFWTPIATAKRTITA